jgi:hypothetical protein
MSNYGIKVSKEGTDVKTATSKDLLISSEFDTIKIVKTGELVLSLPSETVTGGLSERTTTVAHGFSDIPLYSPMIRGYLYGLDDFLGGDYITRLESGGDYIVNDLSEVRIPAGGYSPALSGEYSSVQINATNLILSVTRFEFMGFPQDFGAREATLYYTIFYNRVDEEFNLL